MLEEFLIMRSLLSKHFRVLLSFLVIFLIQTVFSQTDSSPLKVEIATRTAAADFNQKKYEIALRDLTPALAADPHSVEALNLKGAILTKLNHYDEARACYDEAVKLSPNFFSARYNIGALYALRHEWSLAIDYYRDLLIDQPNNELLEYKLLLLLLHQNSDPKLQAKLFATDLPTNTPAWYYAKAARLYKSGESEEAAKYLRVAKNIYNDQVDIFQEELDESGLNATK